MKENRATAQRSRAARAGGVGEEKKHSWEKRVYSDIP